LRYIWERNWEKRLYLKFRDLIEDCAREVTKIQISQSWLRVGAHRDHTLLCNVEKGVWNQSNSTVTLLKTKGSLGTSKVSREDKVLFFIRTQEEKKKEIRGNFRS